MKQDIGPVISPDDIIDIDCECYCKLLSLWSGKDYEEMLKAYRDRNVIDAKHIPTDLIMSKTVPLPNFYISWMWPENLICNTYNEADIMFMSSKICICCNFYEGQDKPEVYYLPIDTDLPITKEDDEHIGDIAILLMDLWYGVQVALLNPQLQNILKNPIKEKIYTREGHGKDRKRVVKYVRKHYITAEDIDEALYGHGHRDFERKTMAWYVIGHWRQYKNGTRKFINGYWKGPLREMKRNLDGGRIRQLAI